MSMAIHKVDLYCMDLEEKFREAIRNDRLAWLLPEQVDEFAAIALASGYKTEYRAGHMDAFDMIEKVLVQVIPMRVY